MTMAKRYSLWMMPSGDIYNRLAKTISQLNREYSTPNFEPHVTLIGRVVGSEEYILPKTSQLATLIRPYEIRLTAVDYLDEYFRCLFIRVEETEHVMDANLKARGIFNRQQDPKYMPHLSLMYGNFTPRIKEKIIAGIGREFNMKFEARSIHIFSTNGEPKDWYRVKELPLLL